MIYGLYLSKWSVVDTAKFVNTNGTIDLDFVILRARGAGHDDSKFTAHRNWLRTAKAKNGALMWGADAFLGYAPDDPSGLQQAVDYWELINAGGKEWEIPPELDVEYQPKTFDATTGKVTSYYAFPADFMELCLHPAVAYLKSKLGFAPTLYTSLQIIKEVFSKNYTVTPPAWLLECPLHIASYSSFDAPAMKYWPTYQFWQFTNTVNWQGVTSICLEKRLGTRADLKAWCKNPTADYVPGAVVPEPIPDPVVPPVAGAVDLSGVLAALAKVEGKVDQIGKHYVGYVS